ncbi:hypothetical protein [Pelagibacterium halotolerans]|uniref:hypothetical protein n=1 Tax=Pelagibacterium halotolerans TaxID=531813 RepID=UPI00384F2593
MSEKIYVSYSVAVGIPYTGREVAHHVVLNYIDDEGSHHVVEAGPEIKYNHTFPKFLALLGTEGINAHIDNQDSKFGQIEVYIREAGPNDLDNPVEDIAQGADLSSQWEAIVNYAYQVSRLRTY